MKPLFLIGVVCISAVFMKYGDCANSGRSEESAESEERRENKTKLKPPKSFGSAIEVEKRTLMCGGPTNPYERVIEALKQPIMSFMEPKIYLIMDEVQEGLRYLFQTKNKWTLPILGTTHLGRQAAIDNVLEAGETLLVAINGNEGERTADLAMRLGIEVQRLEKPYGVPFSLQELESAIKKYKPKAFFIHHGERSTGVFQDVAELGEICRDNGVISIVDFHATLGVVPVFADRWKIDVGIGCSEKGLGGIAGWAPVTFSSRAVDIIKARKSPVRTVSTDMKWLIKFWRGSNRKRDIEDDIEGEDDGEEDEYERRFVHTLPVPQLYGLRESLAIMAEETLEKSWNRHYAATMRFWDGMDKSFVEHYVKRSKSRLIGTVTIKIPDDVKDIRKLRKYAINKFKISIGVGYGKTRNKLITVSMHGENTEFGKVDMALKAIREGVKFIKGRGDIEDEEVKKKKGAVFGNLFG